MKLEMDEDDFVKTVNEARYWCDENGVCMRGIPCY